MHYLTATCWNKNAIQARECKDHPRVRPTTYTKVHNLIGTSGCSKEEPYWNWSVLGIIDTPNGSLIVNPGDWIIEHHDMLLGIVNVERLGYLEQFLPIERIEHEEINLLNIVESMDGDKLEAIKLNMIGILEQFVHEAATNPVAEPYLKTDDRLNEKYKHDLRVVSINYRNNQDN